MKKLINIKQEVTMPQLAVLDIKNWHTNKRNIEQEVTMPPLAVLDVVNWHTSKKILSKR
jgi:hypothetical protein